VSKATKRHCAGTVQSQGGTVEKVGFEPRPEDSYGRCRSDKIRQTKRCSGNPACGNRQNNWLTNLRLAAAAATVKCVTLGTLVNNTVLNVLQVVYYL